MHADIADKLNVIEVAEPVGIVDHEGLVGPELDKAAHLLFEALAVVVDLVDSHHAAQVLAAGRISDHASAAAHQGDRFVARLLQPLHQKQGHKMTNVQRIRSGIKSDIKSGLSIVHEITDLVLVRQLGQKPPGLQFLKDFHFDVLLFEK